MFLFGKLNRKGTIIFHLQNEIAATSISGPTHRIKEKDVESLFFLIMNAAKEISRQLCFTENGREEGVARMGQAFFLY